MHQIVQSCQESDIIVVVEGGMVRSVYTKESGLKATVVDLDSLQETEENLEEVEEQINDTLQDRYEIA